MKNLITKPKAVALFLFFLGFISVNAQTKDEIKSVLQYVEYMLYNFKPIESIESIKSIDSIYSINPLLSLGQYSILLSHPNISFSNVGLKGFLYDESTRITLVPPGVHHLSTFYSNEIKNVVFTTNESAYFIPVTAAFEPGKFYTFDYDKTLGKKNSSISVSIIEVTESTHKVSINSSKKTADKIHNNAANALKTVKSYLSWHQPHLADFEGVFNDKKGKTTITFTGNKYEYLFYFSGKEFIFGGTFLFNENTIILINEFSSSDGKIRQVDGIEIWYYKYNNGVLDVIDRSKQRIIRVGSQDQFFKSSK